MASGVPMRRTGFGLAGSLAGLLALIAVAIPQWVLPLPQPSRAATVEVHQTITERIVAKVKKIGHHKQEKREPAGWREGFQAVAMLLAFVAVGFGVVAVLRGEVLVFAGVAATLGFGAIAFQLTLFYAIAASLMVILYAAMERPSGAVELASIAAGAILVLSAVALFGMGLLSVLLLAGAAIAVLSLEALFCGL